MTTYRLAFRRAAEKEWRKLNPDIRKQFAKKLKERLAAPHVVSAQLHGMSNCYKIKLRAAGYRLVYEVEDDKVVVIVVAVGRRDRNLVYKVAAKRL